MRRSIAVVASILLGSTALFGIGPKERPPRNLAILIFPGVQIIDYTGPWEVFGHAFADDAPVFRIYTVAEKIEPITTAMGMSVNPAFTLATAPKPDVLVVPGGNVEPQLDNGAVIAWLRSSARGAEVVLSVCNGAFFLAKAGLLDGLEATTFAGLIDELKAAAPKTRVVSDKRFVDNGKIVTAAGLSSGIDGALHVIEKLCGKGTAQVAALSLEYDWRPDSGYARASLADRHLRPAFAAMHGFSRSVLRHEGTRDRWETSWKVQTDAGAVFVLDRLDRAFGSATNWVRGRRGDSRGVATSAWSLRDSDGGRWVETTRVESVKEEKGYRVTVAVARAPTG
jgi:putative intracellular protease/amidase